MSEPPSPKPKKLLDQLRETIYIKHYSNSTEKTYVHWAKRFILFHNKRHPKEIGVEEVQAVLNEMSHQSAKKKTPKRTSYSSSPTSQGGITPPLAVPGT